MTAVGANHPWSAQRLPRGIGELPLRMMLPVAPAIPPPSTETPCVSVMSNVNVYEV
jgi:hypothetical protein